MAIFRVRVSETGFYFQSANSTYKGTFGETSGYTSELIEDGPDWIDTGSGVVFADGTRFMYEHLGRVYDLGDGGAFNFSAILANTAQETSRLQDPYDMYSSAMTLDQIDNDDDGTATLEISAGAHLPAEYNFVGPDISFAIANEAYSMYGQSSNYEVFFTGTISSPRAQGKKAVVLNRRTG